MGRITRPPRAALITIGLTALGLLILAAGHPGLAASDAAPVTALSVIPEHSAALLGGRPRRCPPWMAKALLSRSLSR